MACEEVSSSFEGARKEEVNGSENAAEENGGSDIRLSFAE